MGSWAHLQRRLEKWGPGHTCRGAGNVGSWAHLQRGLKHGVLGTPKVTVLLDDMLEGILILLIFAKISQMIIL